MNEPTLSPAQVAEYKAKGYTVVPRALRPELLARLRAVTDELVAGASKVSQATDLYDLEDDHTPQFPRVRRLKVPFQHHPFFNELARHPDVIGRIVPLLGPNIRLHGNKLNMKSAGGGSAVEWHQDWAFYPHTNDDVLAVGIYLDDCGLDNGPLLCLPGSHLGPTYDHHVDGFFAGAMDPVRSPLPYDRAEPLYGPAGSMTIHHARTVHGSALNTSNRTRRLLLYEFAAADAWPLRGWTDLDEFNSRMVAGTPTIEPRVVPAPIRMPYPPAPFQGSIYENQRSLKNRFFAAAGEAKRAET
jgi:ectoine hydroxylase-related dioxygenase (phytanoyl-CoA dioxygenase family)